MDNDYVSIYGTKDSRRALGEEQAIILNKPEIFAVIDAGLLAGEKFAINAPINPIWTTIPFE